MKGITTEERFFQMIRDCVEESKKPSIDVAIDAMNERELIELINRYDTSYKSARHAYMLLRKIDKMKYTELTLPSK